VSAFAISCINDILGLNRSEEEVTVNIPNDATTDEIIDILSDNGLVKQKTFCKIFYKAFTFVKNINKSKKPADPVYLGDIYYVQKNLGLEGYLTEFKEIAKTADTVSLVFPEGWTVYQIFDKIDEFGVCSKEELLASLGGADFDYEFIDSIANDPNRTFKLEGYLYPDTYEFYEESSANSVIRKFLDASENKWTDEYQAQCDSLGMTRDEILIIASIIQREAANTEQMGLVSSVLHNRLDHSVSWPLLGCDSTANYIKNYARHYVSPSQAIVYEQNYDTYISQGLPPGPICNPGNDAINAALFPEDTDYYYFRHDKYGDIYMAKTQAEHDRNGIEVLRVNSR
ncbi:MAG: endolytic transglycosylase MltG, partial [Clostridia bacterium]|nr:endolytic transglycosylase MltG [Clostridia bacterium]